MVIHKTFGCTRVIYNHYLEIKQTECKNNKTSKSAHECIKSSSTLYRKTLFKRSRFYEFKMCDI